MKSQDPLRFRFGDFESTIIFARSVDLSSFAGASGTVLVFDRNTSGLFRKQVESGGPDRTLVVLSPGEKSKGWPEARRILAKALEAGLGRDGLIVGIGGGMICDLAAFSASVYMRGCRLALLPTSLLAMVDAAVGGKTAINFGGYKNMVGTFYPAGEIRIDTELLKSLPDREFKSGLAEAIKTALLGDQMLLEILSQQRARVLQREQELMEEIVRRCIAVKGALVEEDMRESGRRAFLNLGHTFAHALEAVEGLGSWSHGEAVAWGLARAAELALAMKLASAEYADTVREILSAYGFRTGLGEGKKTKAILEAMAVDKKKREGKLRLVLQRGIGDTVVIGVDEALIRRIFG